MKILLVISSLGPGGAERVMSSLANTLAAHGHLVVLVTQSELGADFYQLNPQVDRISIHTLVSSNTIFESLVNNFKRIHRLHRLFRDKQPDCIVSFLTRENITTLLAVQGLKVPVIVSEHTDPERFPLDRVWNNLRRQTYSHASALVVLTEDNRHWFSKEVRCPIEVIPNGVMLSPGHSNTPHSAETEKPARLVTAMGRLDHGKGFDLLLRAWALVQPQFSGWRLAILGDGVLRTELEQMSRALGVSSSVTFLGLVKEPSAVLQSADLFVLSSRYEGFPNALIEAMACGLPVVATRCTGSIAEIVRDGQDGLLVPVEDVPALAQAMRRLMSDPALRADMGAHAVEVTQRYSIEKIMGQWEALIEKVSSQADL